MKKILIVLMLAGLVLLTACKGKTDNLSGGLSDISDTVSGVSEAKAREVYKNVFRVPKGAENVKWDILNSSTEGGAPVLKFDFDLDGKTFLAREELTESNAYALTEQSYEWTAIEPFSFTDKSGNTLSGESYRYIGENEYADLCIWYDLESGMCYSVFVRAESLDGFDLQAIVEEITP